MTHFALLLLLLSTILSPPLSTAAKTHQWPSGGTTKFYDFKVQTLCVKKICSNKDIVTINQKFPGPVISAQEDDRVIVKVTNQSPYNFTMHWHGVRQRLSCWFDGPSYITQCPIQPGKSFTYEFTMVKQKGTFFYHAHTSWLRGTVYGALIVYPKKGVPYPFKYPYQEHIVILGEYWLKNMVQLEKETLDSGGNPPPSDAFTINGHPGPNYKCSSNDVYKIDVVQGKTYMLRLINAGLNVEHFFTIANHKMTIIEADADYTKPFTTDNVMLGPGQTLNVLVTADQPIGQYTMAMGPYVSAENLTFQNISSIAYFNYLGAAAPSPVSIPAKLPTFNDNLAVKTVMDGLRSLNPLNVPKQIDTTIFVTVGLNVDKCESNSPLQHCRGVANGTMAASMNNITFVKPSISILEAYYKNITGQFTTDFPGAPLQFYDFVNGAPNNAPNNTQASKGTKVKVIEFGAKVQIIFQNTGTLGTENHPIHLHGYNFYVVGFGYGNFDPLTVKFNLEDPPYMNTIGVPVGGWAAVRFVADNPGVWFMHCHIEVHQAWGMGTVLIVKNGKGVLETLPHPPADFPRC